MSARYAIYYVPPRDSALWQRGCRWLGRDPETGIRWRAPRWLATDDWRALVAEPARYGLHATLKAPFHLTEPSAVSTLEHELARICARYRPFTLPPLQLAGEGGYVILRPRTPDPRMNALAADCLETFEPLRAQTGNVHRRHRGGRARLNPRQRELLRSYGYPHCAERFRFHLTLTSRLSPHVRQQLVPMLRLLFAPVLRAERTPVHELAIFRQAHAHAPLELTHRVSLAAETSAPIAKRVDCTFDGNSMRPIITP